jgi:hypothetical protein
MRVFTKEKTLRMGPPQSGQEFLALKASMTLPIGVHIGREFPLHAGLASCHGFLVARALGVDAFIELTAFPGGESSSMGTVTTEAPLTNQGCSSERFDDFAHRRLSIACVVL